MTIDNQSPLPHSHTHPPRLTKLTNSHPQPTHPRDRPAYRRPEKSTYPILCVCCVCAVCVSIYYLSQWQATTSVLPASSRGHPQSGYVWLLSVWLLSGWLLSGWLLSVWLCLAGWLVSCVSGWTGAWAGLGWMDGRMGWGRKQDGTLVYYYYVIYYVWYGMLR